MMVRWIVLRAKEMRRGTSGALRKRDSQVIEREQLRNTAKDHKHGDGEVHHATVHIISRVL